MTKRELLNLMRLLSALESWGYLNNFKLPDYLADDIRKNVKLIETEILAEPLQWPEIKGPLP